MPWRSAFYALPALLAGFLDPRELEEDKSHVMDGVPDSRGGELVGQ
jgi:hypothetical protein